ncbi:DUF177 domain-containing protein [Paracoccaceae bacterium]|nr:DUF177 domain-containing protein [Paracoccaceae bacterium]
MKKIQEIDNFSYIILLEQIKRDIEHEFHLVCSKDALRELPKRLNVLEAKKASFIGHLKLQVANQIFLYGTVKAKLIQPCSLTLEPVVTNIYKKIARTFFVGSNENKLLKKSVFELTEKSFDNDIILDEINLGDVLMETISLETPDYPKKSGASIGLTRTESVDRENPFSILRKLKR